MTSYRSWNGAQRTKVHRILVYLELAAREKAPDPQTVPLALYTFERYATGEVWLRTLAALLRRRFYIGNCAVRGLVYA